MPVAAAQPRLWFRRLRGEVVVGLFLFCLPCVIPSAARRMPLPPSPPPFLFNVNTSRAVCTCPLWRLDNLPQHGRHSRVHAGCGAAWHRVS